MIPANPRTAREQTVAEFVQVRLRTASEWFDENGEQLLASEMHQSCLAVGELQEDAREMSWLLRRCLAEADLTNAPELLGLLTAWTVTHKDEYPPLDSEASA